jgi:periplasmic protein TonB
LLLQAPEAMSASPVVEYLRKRGPALVIVGLMHAGAIAVMAADRLSMQEHVNTTPLLVRFFEPERAVPPPRPPPPVKIERSMPTVVAPELLDLPPSQWQIAAAPQAPKRPPPPVPQATDDAPITEARFDADYLNNPSPSYPPLSRRMREQGTVILRVRVREDGQPAEVLIERGSGHKRLDEAAQTAVKNWRFVPARSRQSAVESWVLVPIEFSLSS